MSKVQDYDPAWHEGGPYELKDSCTFKASLDSRGCAKNRLLALNCSSTSC